MDIHSEWDKKARKMEEFYQDGEIENEIKYISPELLHELFNPSKELFGITIGTIRKVTDKIGGNIYKAFKEQAPEISFEAFLEMELKDAPYTLAYIKGCYILDEL